MEQRFEKELEVNIELRLNEHQYDKTFEVKSDIDDSDEV